MGTTYNENVPVQIKTFTGTLDGGGAMLPQPHGLNFDKIISVDALVHTTTGDVWVHPSCHLVATSAYIIQIDETNVQITNAQASVQSQPYRISIWYR